MGMSYDFLLPHSDPNRKRTGVELYLYRIWFHIGQLCGANLLFLLFCLPVITIPASYTALCRVTVRMIREEPVHVWSDFFTAFRSCFGKSLPVALATLLAPVLAMYVVPFYRAYAQQSSLFLLPLGIVALATVFQLMMGFYAYPMLACLELGAGTVIRNSALLTLAKLPQNLLTVAICALLWLIVVLLLPLSLALLVFMFFSVLSLAANSRVWPVIEDYVVRKS